MSDAQPQLSPAYALATPHQLCKWCKRYADAFRKIRPTLKRSALEPCPRYDTVEDLVVGALQGCHLCILTTEDIKQRLDFEEEEWPTWLQTPMNSDLMGLPTTNLAIHSRIRTHGGEAHISLKISPVGDSIDPPMFSSFMPVEARNTEVDETSTSPEWMQRVRLSHQIGTGDHYRLIKGWLDACIDKAQHPQCHTDSEYRRPTRLLDLTYYHEDVRLVDGESSDAPYAALSYCWGSVPQLMLLPDNLQCFREKMPLAEFSRVSRDAISVCRSLSISYLWIDALCIVQGKDGDFSTEAQRMRDVYGGSIVTIVAASSKDTTESFLVRRNPLEWLDCNFSPAVDPQAAGYWASPDFFCEGGEPGEFHIDTRAWCLQERLMAPRCIYFGKKGIHWECRQGIACEVRPDIKRNHTDLVVGNYEHNGLKSEYAELQTLQPNNTSDALRAELIWRNVLRAYSEMSISHIEDKLIAIAGVASVLETKFKWTSTYGLWTGFIVQELLWQSASRDSTGRDERLTKNFPSWSWISSHDHPVLTEYPKRVTYRRVESYLATAVSWPADSGFEMPLSDSPRDKSLRIKGYLVPCKSTWTEIANEEPDHPPPSGTRYGHNKANGYRRSYLADPNAPSTNLFCLLLLCQHFPDDKASEYRNHGLVLTPVDIARRCYRRVGIITEDFPRDYYPDAPSAQRVQERFLTDMWAPVGEEQEVCIV